MQLEERYPLEDVSPAYESSCLLCVVPGWGDAIVS
jgi:hypothetical protein